MSFRMGVGEVRPELLLRPGAAERAVELSLGSARDVDMDTSVLLYVHGTVSSTPDQPAVIDGTRVWSYADLSLQVTRISTALKASGCGMGDVVAAVGRRSAETVAVFLALESLGAVYAPVAQDWPTQRVADVLALGGARFLLDYSEDESLGCCAAEAAVLTGVPRISPAAFGGQPSDEPRRTTGRHGLEPRYRIFTSGTTGRPKGVTVEHQGMMNHLWAKVDALSLTRHDAIAFTSPLSFVISVWQMLAPLLLGGTVVVARDFCLASPRRLLHFLEQSRVTAVELVPTLINWIVDQVERMEGPRLTNLRWLVSTGEELPAGLAERVGAALPGVRLLNAYGATETSDDVIHHEVSRADAQSRIPLGSPIANAQLYLLCRDDNSDEWRAAEPGEPGELFVGGAAVSHGYVGGAGSAEPAFFNDPFDAGSLTGRLYRTGDLAQFHHGAVHYLGRADRQVKISGVRIELDEIEVILDRHPSITRSAVTVVEVKGRQRLAAFFTTSQSVDTGELHKYLAVDLPPAAIPGYLVELENLPLSQNGKIDYKFLRKSVSSEDSI
jgi:D-alanine--poly(phosphoribitol) ligase subunit 1